MFSLNPRSGTPICRQLMAQILWQVASKQLKPGEELPSVRAVAVRYAANATTISKGYMLLEAEGVLARLTTEDVLAAEREAARGACLSKGATRPGPVNDKPLFWRRIRPKVELVDVRGGNLEAGATGLVIWRR